MYTSPATHCTPTNKSHWPRQSTSTTPPMDSAAPSICRRLMAVPKNRRPMSSIHTGVLAPTRVTFMAVELVSARYCRAL